LVNKNKAIFELRGLLTVGDEDIARNAGEQRLRAWHRRENLC
jgi:hypothetical protein